MAVVAVKQQHRWCILSSTRLDRRDERACVCCDRCGYFPCRLQWFYNVTTQQLYFFYNGTGSPPTSNQYVVTSDLKVLFNISSVMANPVENVTFHGLTYVV